MHYSETCSIRFTSQFQLYSSIIISFYNQKYFSYFSYLTPNHNSACVLVAAVENAVNSAKRQGRDRVTISSTLNPALKEGLQINCCFKLM